MKIGKTIAELRKTKGITQEDLAAVIGVSPQAVSKWESGGSPDIELLPAIADYFKVSIDRLFERSAGAYVNIQSELMKSVTSIPAQPDYADRLAKVFEYCWLLEASIMGDLDEDLMTIDQVIAKAGPDNHSQMFLNTGITSLNINEALRYFLIMPEPRNGWKQELHYDESFRSLFETLSDEDTLKTIFYLYGKKVSTFTPKLLEKDLKISGDKAAQILRKLLELGLLKSSEVDLDGEIVTVYQFKANIAFIPFLTFAYELLHKPQRYVMWGEVRKDSNPLLK